MADRSSSIREQIYRMLRRSEQLPPAEFGAYQQSVLAKMVAHAQSSVPYYRERLRGVVVDGRIDPEAWAQVPILTRRDVQQNFDALQSNAVPTGHLPLHLGRTSGTSGVPVSYNSTAMVKTYHRAQTDRFYAWNNLHGQHALIMIKGDTRGPYPDGERFDGAWLEPWVSDAPAGVHYALRHPLEPALQIEFLMRYGACYLNTQPSNARALARTVLRGLAPRPDIRGVITLGELVTADDRALMREAFDAPVHDIYSATEVGVIASECACGAMHINGEGTVVEIAGTDGAPCGPGESGRIVATQLVNLAMPLVRYDTGDIGTWGPRCTCGVTLPVLRLTVGRDRNLFRFSDGTEVLGLVSPERYAEFFPVTQWQVAQTGPEEIEIRFSSDADEDRLAYERVTTHLQEYFRRPLAVRFRRLESLPVGNTGKLDAAVRELQR